MATIREPFELTAKKLAKRVGRGQAVIRVSFISDSGTEFIVGHAAESIAYKIIKLMVKQGSLPE